MSDNSVSKLDGIVNNKGSLPEKIAFVLFCATSVQLALLKTFVPVIVGVKADVYSGALCAITLSFAILATGARGVRIAWTELVISGALITLAICSGVFSSTPWSSTVWALTWGGNALGGFWAARLLLTNPVRVKIFVWICAGTLNLLLILSLWGYYFHGLSQYFVDNLHQLVNIILLLSFASLALISGGKILGVIFGCAVLLSSYAALYVCGVGGVEAALLIPPVILVPGLILTLSGSKSRLGPIIVVLFAVAVTAHYISWVSGERFSDKGYQQERLEFYTFSGHVAKQSPWVGIGLRTPRDAYLSDYEVRQPHQTRGQFAQSVSWLVTSQNIFLTFMVGFGIPFAAIYLFAVVFLVIRLVRATFNPDPNWLVPPLALLIPITGALLHFMMMDIILMPQIAWFFHILLALIPKPALQAQRKKINLGSALSVVGLTVAAALFGIVLGTHPAFKPENFPSTDEIKDKFKNLPLVSSLFESKAASVISAPLDWASLTVNIQGYHGKPPSWAMVCVLDNSPSMARLDASWNPNRISAGLKLIEHLGTDMGSGNKLAVRDFANEGPLKRKGRELVLRVSRIELPWTEVPWKSDYISRFVSSDTSENNLCAASESALTRDFVAISTKFGARILLITDAATECSLDPLLDAIKKNTTVDNRTILDVALLGATGTWAEQLQVGATETGGFSFNVTSPEGLNTKLMDYLKILKTPVIDPVLLTTKDHTRKALPGSTVELQAGSYDITIPEIEGIDKSNRKIEGIKVSGGENKVVNIVVHQGQLTVE